MDAKIIMIVKIKITLFVWGGTCQAEKSVLILWSNQHLMKIWFYTSTTNTSLFLAPSIYDTKNCEHRSRLYRFSFENIVYIVDVVKFQHQHRHLGQHQNGVLIPMTDMNILKKDFIAHYGGTVEGDATDRCLVFMILKIVHTKEDCIGFLRLLCT